MNKPCLIEFSHTFDTFLKKFSGVFWGQIFQWRGGFNVSNHFFDKDVVLYGERFWTIDVCFLSTEEIFIFALCPSKDYLTPMLLKIFIAWVLPDVMKHFSEIAILEAVNFNNNYFFLFGCQEDIAFFSNANRAEKFIKMIVAVKLKKGAFRVLIEDSFECFEAFLGCLVTHRLL